MFLGYTPSSNRRYKPYTAENIIAQMKKEGLLSGENFDYGLSSLMSRFATKQKSMEELKESAKDGLYSSKQLNEDYENLKKEYEELGDKVAPLYWDKYSFYNDTKKVSDLKISRYANVAKVNNNEYLLEFVSKDNGEVLLYSVDLLDKRKQYRENASSKNSMHHDTVNNSIAHIQDTIKSKLVQKYNNDYKNAYKNNNLEQSQKRTGYVFQEPAQPNLFVENAAQNHNKGFVGIDLKGNRGLTDINRNLILIGTTGYEQIYKNSYRNKTIKHKR